MDGKEAPMNAIQKYFKYRQSLIDQYAKGDMTKREYLRKNYEAVVYGDIGPFHNMDTVEKALFNYQYYNALAKENKTISTTRDMDYELKRDYIEKSNYFYSKKDRATLTALRMMDFKGVEAYFVKVRSKFLKGKLFENRDRRRRYHPSLHQPPDFEMLTGRRRISRRKPKVRH